MTNGFPELTIEEEFAGLLKLEKAIVYLQVDWSGPERSSRAIINDVLKAIEVISIPIYWIDCSDESKPYVINWLLTQKEEYKYFNYGGYGETLLIAKGNIIDFIAFPGKTGLLHAKQTLNKWLSQPVQP